MLRICTGNGFHKSGAEAEKARCPYDAVLSSLRGGYFSWISDEERRERDGVRMVMMS